MGVVGGLATTSKGHPGEEGQRLDGISRLTTADSENDPGGWSRRLFGGTLSIDLQASGQGAGEDRGVRGSRGKCEPGRIPARVPRPGVIWLPHP